MRTFLSRSLAALSFMAVLGFANDAKAQFNVKEYIDHMGDYVHPYLHEEKATMNGMVVTQSKTETQYDDKMRPIHQVVTLNGMKQMEISDYVYDGKTTSYIVTYYLNGAENNKEKFTNTYMDDDQLYPVKMVMEAVGPEPRDVRISEHTYNDEGLITHSVTTKNGVLEIENKNYVYTPNSCDYEFYTTIPAPANGKGHMEFKDGKKYLREVEETVMDYPTGPMKTRSEHRFDENGMLAGSKVYTNGELSFEFKDYVWGDKKCNYTQVTYANGQPLMVTEISEYYKGK